MPRHGRFLAVTSHTVEMCALSRGDGFRDARVMLPWKSPPEPVFRLSASTKQSSALLSEMPGAQRASAWAGES